MASYFLNFETVLQLVTKFTHVLFPPGDNVLFLHKGVFFTKGIIANIKAYTGWFFNCPPLKMSPDWPPHDRKMSKCMRTWMWFSFLKDWGAGPLKKHPVLWIDQLFRMRVSVFKSRTDTTPWNTIFSQSDNHLFKMKSGNLFRKRSGNAYSHKIT